MPVTDTTRSTQKASTASRPARARKQKNVPTTTHNHAADDADDLHFNTKALALTHAPKTRRKGAVVHATTTAPWHHPALPSTHPFNEETWNPTTVPLDLTLNFKNRHTGAQRVFNDVVFVDLAHPDLARVEKYIGERIKWDKGKLSEEEFGEVRGRQTRVVFGGHEVVEEEGDVVRRLRREAEMKGATGVRVEVEVVME